MKALHILTMLGDLLALLAFTFVGRWEHRLPLSLIESLYTTAPLMIGWLMAGSMLKLYRVERITFLRHNLQSTALTLLLGLPLALLIRYLIFGEDVNLIFAIVAAVFTSIFIFSWRLVLGLGIYYSSRRS